MDDIEHLSSLVRDIEHPDGICPVVPGRIRGAAFFPGGTGVVVGNDPRTMTAGRTLPRSGVLVLGHNFHDVANYEETVRRGGEIDRNATWRALLLFLRSCGINPEAGFYTNALMGLMDKAGATGSHPGHRAPAFRASCRRLLGATIDLQRPRLVLTLGRPATRFLGEVVGGLGSWARMSSFPRFDSGELWRAGLGLPSFGHGPMAAVALVHPCLRGSNLRHRTYDGRKGAEAELAMTRYAMRACDMLSGGDADLAG
jgi:hypothetical protein